MMILAVLQAAPWSDLLNRIGVLGQDAQRWGLYLLAAAALLLLGWGVGAALSWLTRTLLRALRFNEGVRRLFGLHGTPRHEPAGLAGWAVYWLVLGVAALFCLEMFGINIRETVGTRLSDVMPRVITSGLLFVAGAVVALLLGAVTHNILETAGVTAARLKGQVVTAILTGFAVLMALEQLGFAAQFVMILGIVVVGVAVLALALAFGLGCRDLARDFVVEYLRSLDEEKPKRPA